MIANNSMGATTSSWDNNDSTDSTNFWESIDPIHCICEEELCEDDLWMDIDRREWKEYLRALWLGVLKLKQRFTSAQHSNRRLYYRRLLIPISGWLARKGYNKKN